jgi:outer membrane translocation and assembly module TamA
MFGASRIIRGYPVGRYLDERLLAGQAEWCWHCRPRWGMVAFGGLGQVGKSFSDFKSDIILVSGGVGLRWMASVENRVNLSVDYALGEHDNYIYIYVGEAF